MNDLYDQVLLFSPICYVIPTLGFAVPAVSFNKDGPSFLELDDCRHVVISNKIKGTCASKDLHDSTKLGGCLKRSSFGRHYGIKKLNA